MNQSQTTKEIYSSGVFEGKIKNLIREKKQIKDQLKAREDELTLTKEQNQQLSLLGDILKKRLVEKNKNQASSEEDEITKLRMQVENLKRQVEEQSN